MDVIEGRGPSPALVLPLIARLPDTSLTHAIAAGGAEHFGWGIDRHMQADIFDALNQNTRATGNWGKKVPNFPTWPRPKVKPSTSSKPDKGKRPVSVRDIHKQLTSQR